METLRVLTAAEQVADYLRLGLESGTWGGRIPGGNKLAGMLGVGRNTVEAALQLMEDEGVLAAQGPGKRRIVAPEIANNVPARRVAILLGTAADRKLDYIVDLQHKLVEAGHEAFYPVRSQSELGRDVARIAWMVKRTKADLWVVLGGSREVLEWFIERKIPAFALFGRRHDLPVAGVGPDKASAFREVVRQLVALGHRRIALVALPVRRLPEPGLPERAFLEELETHGIPTGPYHLPDWEESPEGLEGVLDSLFKATPPTALLIDEAHLFHAVKHHLSGKGIRTPEDVSLVCTDPDPTFEWCRPTIAHIRWDSRPVVRRILRWSANVSRGKKDRRQTFTPAKFVSGGTVGAVIVKT